MQAVLANYISSKQYIEKFFKDEGEPPLPGIIQDILYAVIGFFGSEEWELCSEACSYLRLLEEHLIKNGKNLGDYTEPRLEPHLELAKLLCKVLPGIRGGGKISGKDLERLGALSKGNYIVALDIVREAFTTLRRHLKGRVPEDALKELNIPSVSKPSVVHSMTLDEQIATINAEFTTARIWAKTLFSGRINEASVGYYLLLLTRNFSRAFELFFATGEEKSMRETWEFLGKLKKLSRERSLSLTRDPDVYHPLQTAEVLHELWSFMEKSMPIPKDTLSRALSILSRERSPLRWRVLLHIKDYFESHNFGIPEELIKVLESFPKPKEIDYWEEYQKTLKEFEERGEKFHRKAKKEWELVKSGKAEDPIGSIQEVIWSLGEAVGYNFAHRRFKLVKEAYEIFLQAYEFAKENNLFKTKLSEGIWLGKLKRVNLKWGNDIKWYEDYRVISNRIIRLARIAEFMMWKRRIPEFLYANPYLNLGGDYGHNDPPLWALTKALMMILDHNRSRGNLPTLEFQEEALDYALRLNLLWPEDVKVLKCKDGKCIVFRGEISEDVLHGFKKYPFDEDVLFYRGKDGVIGYSRKRKLGYVCGKEGVDGLIREALRLHKKA